MILSSRFQNLLLSAVVVFLECDPCTIAAPLPESHQTLFCGNRELQRQESHTKRQRRSLNGEFGTLPGKTLHYGVVKYPRDDLHGNISENDLNGYVDEALQAAVKLWDDAIEAKFVERKGKGPDIQISFSTFYHGDEFPFDGMGNEIAHAFYPNDVLRHGQIHIDDNEPWGPSGRNLKWVLAHEIGHSLGLPHTLEQSIMMPYYGGYEAAEPHLSAYDIDVIQKLYGKKKQLNPDTLLAEAESTVNPQFEVPSLCNGKRFDTIFALPNNTIVIFKGDHFWMLDDIANDTLTGPFQIINYFGDIQVPIEAAFTDHLDWTWLIKGDLAWRVDASGDQLRLFAAEEIHETKPFSNYEFNSVDAVLPIFNDKQFALPIFYFLGPKYWYDTNADGDANGAGYYRQVQEIDSRLKFVDDAISIPSGDFIISDGLYWKVNRLRNFLKAEKDYPRSVSEDWFGCSR